MCERLKNSWLTNIRCVRLVAWSKQCVTSEIKWLTVFWRGFRILYLFALELKNDGWLSTEQSFAGIDKILIYYTTFNIFFVNKYENLFKILTYSR